MWRLWTVVVQGVKPASTTWSIRTAFTQVSNLVESQQVDKRERPSLEKWRIWAVVVQGGSYRKGVEHSDLTD